MYNLLLHCAIDCFVDAKNLKKVLELKQLKREYRRQKEIEEKPKVELLTDKKNSNENENSLNKEIEELDVNAMEVINLRADQVHVIDELEVVGKSIKSQIENLEWWQDIKSNVDVVDLVDDLAKFKPELKELITKISYNTLLTHPDKKLNMIIEKMFPEEDTPVGRFRLLGGLSELLQSMKSHDVNPNQITINLILQVNQYI